MVQGPQFVGKQVAVQDTSSPHTDPAFGSIYISQNSLRPIIPLIMIQSKEFGSL